jgi:hypothetical protein
MRTTEPDGDTQEDRDQAELSALCKAVMDAQIALQERQGEVLGHITAMTSRCRCRTLSGRATHRRELKRAMRLARNVAFASY